MLRTRRELWVWCALPVVINLATFAVAIAAFVMWLWDPLSQSLAAMMRTSLRAVDLATEVVQNDHGRPWIGETVVVTTSVLALAAWAALIYVGPALSIRRSPVPRSSRWRLVALYVLLLLVTIVLAVDAHVVQDAVLEEPEPLWQIVLWQLVQPLVW